jgi:hypothetical protein
MPRDAYGVRIPANIDYQDHVLGPFTARQVAILAVTAATLWLAFMATRHVVPLPVFAALAVPVAAAGFAIAVVRRDGIGLDQLARAALRHHLTPRRFVAAPAGVQPPPSFVSHAVAAKAQPLPAPLNLPVTGIGDDGIVELGGEGRAALVACSTVSFALATPVEQEAMVAGFARALNSLSAPVQVVVRARRVDLAGHIDRLEQEAPGLPHPALEHAAREHAAFLADLADRADLLWHQVLLVVREPGTGDRTVAADQVRRNADQLARQLAAAGVTATVLDAAQAEAVLADACDPARGESR